MNILKGIFKKPIDVEEIASSGIETKQENTKCTKERCITIINDTIYLVDKVKQSVKFLQFNNENRKVLLLTVEGMQVDIEFLEKVKRVKLTAPLDIDCGLDTLNVIYQHNNEKLVNDILIKTNCTELEETVLTDLKYLQYEEISNIKYLKAVQCDYIADIKNLTQIETVEFNEINKELNLTDIRSSVTYLKVDYCDAITGTNIKGDKLVIGVNQCNRVNCTIAESVKIKIIQLELLESINKDANLEIDELSLCPMNLKDTFKDYKTLIINNLVPDKTKSLTLEEDCRVFDTAFNGKDIETLIFKKKAILLNFDGAAKSREDSKGHIKTLIFEDTSLIFLPQLENLAIDSMYIGTKGADIVAPNYCANLNIENILVDADSSTLLNMKLEAVKSRLKYLSINIKDKTDYCLDNRVLALVSISTELIDSIYLRGNFVLDEKILCMAKSAKKLVITGKLIVPENITIPDNISCKQIVTDKQDRINMYDYRIGEYSALDLIRQFNVRDNTKSITELAEGIYNKFLKEV